MSIYLYWVITLTVVSAASIFLYSRPLREKMNLKIQIAKSLEEDNSKLEKQVVALKEGMSQLSEELGQIPSLHREIEILRSRESDDKVFIGSLTKKLEDLVDLNSGLQNRISQQNEKHQMLLAEKVASYEEKLFQAKSVENMLKASVEEKELQAASLLSQVAEKNSELQKEKAERSALEERLKEYSTASLVLRRSTAVRANGIVVDNRKALNKQVG